MGFAWEDQLLFKLSRIKLDEEALASASSILLHDLDWKYVLDASIAHAVAPLCHSALRQLQETTLETRVPPHIRDEWKRLYLASRSRNLEMYRTIATVVREFDRAGIQVMGLKDIQLAKEIYPDAGLRPMGDIDLLIHSEDFERAAKCLSDIRFFPTCGIDYVLKYAWGQKFQRAADNLWIDLQTNVVEREWDVYDEGNFDLQIGRMWRGAIEMSLGGSRILVPNAADMLFHLCLHLDGHRFTELILFCDIAESINYYGDKFDWAYFVNIVKKYRAESSTYYVLLLVQRLFGAQLPSNLLTELEPTYIDAHLFQPLFGNLSELHYLLDEIRDAASPPDQAMEKFERVARRQARAAMEVYREINSLAMTFFHSGGSLIIPAGKPSERIYPDATLNAFGNIYLFTLKADLPRLRHVLSQGGYTSRRGSAEFTREWLVPSADPVLASAPTYITVQLIVKSDLEELYSTGSGESITKRDAAIQVIKLRMARREADETLFRVPIIVVSLAVEELLIYLCAQLMWEPAERLYCLSTLLELLRCSHGEIDWRRASGIVMPDKLRGGVGSGLALLTDISPEEDVPQEALRSFPVPLASPRVLEWARYDPTTWGRDADLKQSFYCLLTLLSLSGFKTKFNYLSGLLFGAPGRKSAVPSILGNWASALTRKPQTSRDLAFWIEQVPRDSS